MTTYDTTTDYARSVFKRDRGSSARWYAAAIALAVPMVLAWTMLFENVGLAILLH